MRAPRSHLPVALPFPPRPGPPSPTSPWTPLTPGERGELAPEWDRERKYVPGRMQLYVTYESEEDGAERTASLSAERPLMAQLLALQPAGYTVPGIPVVQVVVKGSAYEAEFRRKVKATR